MIEAICEVDHRPEGAGPGAIPRCIITYRETETSEPESLPLPTTPTNDELRAIEDEGTLHIIPTEIEFNGQPIVYATHAPSSVGRQALWRHGFSAGRASVTSPDRRILVEELDDYFGGRFALGEIQIAADRIIAALGVVPSTGNKETP